MKQSIFETGATTHAVNDLILFTDNTRELAEFRDAIYSDWVEAGNFGTERLANRFVPLFKEAQNTYCRELSDHKHIALMAGNDIFEYCQLYVDDLNSWKQEHGY